MNRRYPKLWKDVVDGLVSKGWKLVGGNIEDYMILRKGEEEIKVFIQHRDIFDSNETNFIVTRYTS
jgi:hypothetical protein